MKIYKIHESNGLRLTDWDGCPSRTAVTVGMFDGVHVGHRHIVSVLMAEARRLGLRPLVVTFDRHPREVLSAEGFPFPRITTNDERYELLAECGVEELVELHFTRAMAGLSACRFMDEVLVGQMQAAALVLGYDNVFGNKQHSDFDRLPVEARRLGVRLCEAAAVDVDGCAVSSTRIRKALANGQVEVAAAMLGSPYTLSGKVGEGYHIGRTLGFPTANVAIPDGGKMLPADGVYGVRATDLDDPTVGVVYTGVANLGARPTFGNENRTLEVHLIGAEGNRYGHTLRVQFVSRLRDIRKFESREALVAQLEEDKRRMLELSNHIVTG